MQQSRIPRRLRGRTAERLVLAVTKGILALENGVDLARSLVHDRRFGVAEVAFDGILVGIAVRAVYLDRLVGGPEPRLGVVPLGQGGFPAAGQSLILEPSGRTCGTPPNS